MVTQYVVGFAYDDIGRVALIEKNRPNWQAGLLNGIGGKVEPGESPLKAMVREFEEETGTRIEHWHEFLLLDYPDARLHFYKAKITELDLDALESITDELIYIFTYEEFFGGNMTQIVKNLSWILPLALYDRAEYLPMHVAVLDFDNEGNDL